MDTTCFQGSVLDVLLAIRSVGLGRVLGGREKLIQIVILIMD